MNNNEQNFEDLKQLLRLKRHEMPPPGYFNNFSSHVLSALREERSGGIAAQFNNEDSWMSRFLGLFDTRPGLVGGLATSLMLLLVFGVVLADHSDNDAQGMYSPLTSSQASPLQGSAPMASSAMPPTFATTDSGSSGGITVSTNPLASLQPSTALFGQQDPMFQNVSFSQAGSPAH